MSKRNKIIVLLSVAVIFIIILIPLMYSFNLMSRRFYYAKDFDIKTVKSSIDYNDNGIDDYTDILYGAIKDAENHPRYDGSYFEGGYPPDNIGVCTDVVWRAFKNAGYNLKDMVDEDIKARPQAYPHISHPDSNIDFRRVTNLHIFFKKYGKELTTDIKKTEEWQPGDIVIFGNDKHIGIVSNRRNKNSIPYVIHNEGQPKREEDYFKRAKPTSHYRFTGYNKEEA